MDDGIRVPRVNDGLPHAGRDIELHPVLARRHLHFSHHLFGFSWQSPRRYPVLLGRAPRRSLARHKPKPTNDDKGSQYSHYPQEQLADNTRVRCSFHRVIST